MTVIAVIAGALTMISSSPQVQQTAKNAKDKTVASAKDAKDKVVDAVATGSEKVQAEVNKRTTRSTAPTE